LTVETRPIPCAKLAGRGLAPRRRLRLAAGFGGRRQRHAVDQRALDQRRGLGLDGGGLGLEWALFGLEWGWLGLEWGWLGLEWGWLGLEWSWLGLEWGWLGLEWGWLGLGGRLLA
jgi:hypothetical protein